MDNVRQDLAEKDMDLRTAPDRPTIGDRGRWRHFVKTSSSANTSPDGRENKKTLSSVAPLSRPIIILPATVTIGLAIEMRRCVASFHGNCRIVRITNGYSFRPFL